MKGKVLKIILYISFIPYILLLLACMYYFIFGLRFIFTNYYGFEAVKAAFVVYGYFFTCVYPVFPICLIYQVIYGFSKLLKKRKEKTDEIK